MCFVHYFVEFNPTYPYASKYSSLALIPIYLLVSVTLGNTATSPYECDLVFRMPLANEETKMIIIIVNIIRGPPG